VNAADGRDQVYNSAVNAVEVGYDVTYIMTLHVCKHSNQLCSVIFVNFFTIFSTMASLCRHLSALVRQFCRVSGVFTPRRHDATRQFRRVGVGGVYWTLVAVNSAA